MSSGHSFSQVPKAEIQRSTFNRSHGVKTTFDAGYLVPIFVDEVLPGDTFNLKTDGFARMATPIYPVMDNQYLETFYFAVPLRLVWDNFQKMMGEQDNPGDSVDFITPFSAAAGEGGYQEQSLHDYMGLPTKVPQLTHQNLPLRAYNLIWNEWFRDQNLQDSVTVDKDDGPDDPVNYTLLRRGKRHDYFTSALPFPQKGDDVTLPLGLSAPISGSAALNNSLVDLNVAGTAVDSWVTEDTGSLPNLTTIIESPQVGAPGDSIDWSLNDPTVDTSLLTADLADATAATINQLRQAFAVQKLLERDARGGTRYTEIVRAHFNVTSPDARLQRPEFLGGGSTLVNITPIASTNDNADTSVGQLGAMGTSSFQNHGFVKSFTEHSIIIGLVNVRADLTYQQGLNRMWARNDKLSYYWPALSHIGEQELFNFEIDVYGAANPFDVFGYQERYAEYRYKPNMITGRFRSNAAQSLDVWHLAQEFADTPVLGDEFIQDNPPIDRVIVTPDEPQYIADFHHKLKCARPMPLFGVPGQIDRF